jgi:regulator of protease activity HflC (stomatin/prohibitin superfamily)
MFGFMKVGPTDYVIHYQAGAVRRRGQGLSFFYYRPNSTIVRVPLASVDVPFVFTETTADFQTSTVQGQLTYRVTEPERLAGLLDFSVDRAGRYQSDDPSLVPERLVHATQVLTRGVIQGMPLRDAIVGSDAIVSRIRAQLVESSTVTMLGVEVLALSILSVAPTPEMARALEADVREQLQQEADDAVYSRRNAAVEAERLIRENELQTEIAVEEKKRTIRETQMQADIAVEERRAVLIEQKSANDRELADVRAYARRAELEPLSEVDWRTLMFAGGSGNDPRTMLALAFRELAENAGKIGELNLTPDLLQALASGSRKAQK